MLFGAGDWRTRTEDRPPPEQVLPGARIALGPSGELIARVVSVSPLSPRLIDVRFDREGAALLTALYHLGHPVQYAHQDRPLDLWSVQTAYAARPWAVEMPSAGRPLSWRVLGQLRRRGVELRWLTHAAGLSSTGDPALDADLPLPERYDIPPATAAAVTRARARGLAIIAVGTTVVRALESAARTSGARGSITAGPGITDLVIGPTTERLVVDGLLSGIHAPGESHFRLLGAFAPVSLLEAAHHHAASTGYLPHELGDLCLVLARPARAARDAVPDPLVQTAAAHAPGGGPGREAAVAGRLSHKL